MGEWGVPERTRVDVIENKEEEITTALYVRM